jgi:hypothetical protein
LQAFYEETPRGALTLPQVVHLPYGVVVLIVVAVALGGFRAAEWVEAKMAIRARSLTTHDTARGGVGVIEGAGA